MSAGAGGWAGRNVTKARSYMETKLPAACGQCGKQVTVRDRWVVGHTIARWERPDLTWEPSNWRIEHRTCSDKTGQAAVIAKAAFTAQTAAGQSPPLPEHTHESPSESLSVPEHLSWAYNVKHAPKWLKSHLEVPADASPPLAMTPPHPTATGSYGPEAIAWVEEELDIVLRWWQRLAFVRQLEHDKDGALCWRVILESGPRRVGKSVRLRAMALWRLATGPRLFGEKQLAIHTGKDVAIVREIHRQAWAWATTMEGWSVKKGVGQEEVVLGENRWLVRAMDAVYGYDVCLGMVDEAWAVKPSAFDEGLEPATMERQSPQLLLTSTAHRRATSLMRKRISAALTTDDGETLLLLWGARPTDDPADPQTWRDASPHWTEDRRKMIAAKYLAASSGQADPDADDLDPMAGFLAQYLNIWRLNAPRVGRGEPVVSAEGWSALAQEPPLAPPDTAAVESWFGDGVSLALGWRVGDKTVVSVSGHPDLPSTVAALKESGFVGTATVGTSLMTDPAFKGVRTRKGEGRTVAVVQRLSRLLADEVLAHDDGGHLTEQVLALRTMPGTDGHQMGSKHRADAVKAAVWCADAARTASAGKPRILTAR